MKEYIKEIRDKIIYDSWEKYKNRLSMEELSECFDISFKSMYRIVKEEKLRRDYLIKRSVQK
jgi:Mor family transcriptional regulator